MERNPEPKSKKINRRDFLRLAGLSGGAAALAACKSGETPAAQPQDDTGQEEQPSTQEKVNISFWTPGGSDVFCQGFDTIAANYMQENPNVEIEKTKCNPGGENYSEVLIANIAAGSPPDATIVWASPVAYAALGALQPLDAAMEASKYSQKENWPEGVLASCIWEGKTYGLPVTAGTYGIFYNEEMFEEKGISSAPEDFPKTWDELRALSKEFTVWEDDVLMQAGFLPLSYTEAYYDMAVQFAIWSAVNGTQLYDAENKKFMLTSPENIELLAYAVDWLDEEYKGDLVAVRASGNWGGYADSEGRPPGFTENRLAAIVNGYWYAGDMYANELKFERWNVASFPVGPSGTKTASGYWPNWLVIPNGSKHVAEVFDYLDYMSVEGVQVWFRNIPDLPTNKLVPEGLLPTTVVEKRGEEFAKEMNAFFEHQLEVATPMWNSPVHDFALDQVGRALEQALGKAQDPESALTEAQNACQAELDRILTS